MEAVVDKGIKLDTGSPAVEFEGRKPLKIMTKCIADDETLLSHIKENSARKLPEFTPAPVGHSGHAVLVGSGPSVATQIESLREQKRKGRTIFAIKGAHDWCLENNIMPDVCIMLDPQAKIKNCIKHKQKQGILYLIASQCHPEVFEDLKDYPVMIWHALSKIGEEEILPGRVLVGGGTTTGLRAINLAWSWGYRKFHLYGYDSSLTDGAKRVNGDKPGKTIEVFCGHRKFQANPAMAAQANELQQMLQIFKNIKLRAYGDGLVQEILKSRIGMGFKEYLDED